MRQFNSEPRQKHEIHFKPQRTQRMQMGDRKKLMDRGNTLIGHHFRPKNSNGRFAMVQLGELCSLTKGNSSSTKTEPGPYPLIVRGEERLSSKSYQFEGDAVCVPLLSLAHGWGQIKRVHFVSGQFSVANLLAVLQPLNNQKLDAKYLYLALDKAKDDLAKQMQGSVYVTLKIGDLANYEIPLPPIDVQKELADEYDRLQSLIAKSRETITRMKQKIQTKLSGIWGS
jgi:restriction endonuclease S subunit